MTGHKLLQSLDEDGTGGEGRGALKRETEGIHLGALLR